MRGSKAKKLRRAVAKAINGNVELNGKRILRGVKKDYLKSSRVLKNI